MPKIYGELQDATFENRTADPSGNTAGRVWRNSTEERVKTDDGTNKRALLRNDQKAVIGNSGTANNNVRFHRGANERIQFVRGGDATAEGSLSNDLAQISGKQESYLDASKPTPANPGRVIWVSDTEFLMVDDGVAFRHVPDSGLCATKGDILVFDGTKFVKLAAGTDGQVIQADSGAASGLSYVAQGSPSGVISAFGGTTAPAGYLLCDGSTVSRATYADLFAAIGENFGEGDGSTTFHLPDLRGQFLRGVDGGAGRDPDAAGRSAMNTGGNTGDNVGSVQSHAMQLHNHNAALGASGTAPPFSAVFNSTNTATATPLTNGMTGNTSSETRPTNAYVNYIIKT